MVCWFFLSPLLFADRGLTYQLYLFFGLVLCAVVRVCVRVRAYVRVVFFRFVFSASVLGRTMNV